jgi:trehalose 6-phosphate phosphatase
LSNETTESIVTKTDIADPIIDTFAALDPTSIALLFDVDGTLIDIGRTPNDVVVPATLRNSLKRLREATGGALALVSGRPIADLDRLFAPMRLSAIGGHGAEMRIGDSTPMRIATPLPAPLRRRLKEDAVSGTLIEDKDYSLALHYRAVPEAAAEVERSARAAIAAFPGEALDMLRGKQMIEVKRRGINKGDGVRVLMEQAPFRGRRPVFVGDDVTDDAVFEALPDLDGIGFSVGRSFAGLAAIFESPADVRRAVALLADRADAIAR